MTTLRSAYRVPSACLVLLCLPAWAGPAFAQSQWIDSPMYHDPDLPPSLVEYVLPEATWRLWLKALERPDADFRCKAAEAIALAHRRGVKGMEATVPNLVAALNREGQYPAVLLAVAHALVALDAKKSADDLWRQARIGGIDLREAIEPTLARWNHAPARAAWLERLGDRTTQPRSLVLAMRGLAVVREGRAVEGLRERVLSNRTPGPIRLEAALALGQIRPEGLEKDAQSLFADASPRGISARLVAVSLLRRHQGKAAVELLRTMAKDREPSIAAIAVGRLIEIDPKLASDVRDSLLASRDPILRSHGTDILLKVVTDDVLALLTRQLDDPHPGVRNKARRALKERAVKGGQKKEVIENATGALASNQRRAQEQAIILLSDLGHKPAAARMVELLSADRPEVFLTAACGLRKLAEPSSLPAALAYLEDEYKRFSVGKQTPGRKDVLPELVDHQLSQLLQLMGNQKHVQAEKIMRLLLPRNDKIRGPGEARAAAIWGLGLLETKSVADLAGALEERLNDSASSPPERIPVRLMSAVTLGRLKAKGALPSLEKWAPVYQMTEDPVSNTCVWAIRQITDGKPIPTPKPRQVRMRNWFLVSNDE